ncbi:MAG: hypothetical protein LBF72_03710 [Holosporales bacterium]|nr:hypothetical protein [Holosporales bacterium]
MLKTFAILSFILCCGPFAGSASAAAGAAAPGAQGPQAIPQVALAPTTIRLVPTPQEEPKAPPVLFVKFCNAACGAALFLGAICYLCLRGTGTAGALLQAGTVWSIATVAAFANSYVSYEKRVAGTVAALGTMAIAMFTREAFHSFPDVAPIPFYGRFDVAALILSMFTGCATAALMDGIAKHVEHYAPL